MTSESSEITLAKKTQRINELRQKMLQSGLNDEELQEGIDLVIECRGLRAGKVSKAKAPEAKKSIDITELF